MPCVQGRDTTTIVLGRVVRCHVHEGVTQTTPSGNVAVDPLRLRPVARLGSNQCASS